MTIWREIGLGLSLTGLVMLVLHGVDITPFLLLGGILLFMKMMLEGKGVGKRFEMIGTGGRAPVASGVTFDDIGGQEVAKRELLEALSFVKDAEKVRKLGIRPLKGILLTGPPGTGKTLMAKAAANYTDAVFLAASGSQFVEMYAGVGAQRVRKLFQSARSQAEKQNKTHAVIFIDEIEVLGGKRGSHASHLEYDQTLNELLVQMDGIGNDAEPVRILLVAATNRPDMLDPALTRPGRFDRTVKVDLPDKDGRLHILKIHTRNRPLASDVDLEEVAKETYGFSGAHLESLVNEAGILALRAGRDQIEMSDMKEAVDKVMLGERLDRRPRAEERERVAYHEAAHALASEIVRPQSVSVVTIAPRGNALGYMRQTPPPDQYLYTKGELVDQISVCLAGAIAEELFFGSRSTGSIGDFDQAVSLAEQIIDAGMSSLGIVSKERVPPKRLHEEVRAIIGEQERVVRGWLEANRAGLERVAKRLLGEEKVTGDEFRSLVGLTDASLCRQEAAATLEA